MRLGWCRVCKGVSCICWRLVSWVGRDSGVNVYWWWGGGGDCVVG